MTLSEILLRLPLLRIAVFGDFMLDHYIVGDVHRVSPEAPVPVINVEAETYGAGGAGNVATNLARLGISTSVHGVTGDDEAADRLVGILDDAGIETSGVIRSSATSTIVKSRVVARGQQVCRIDREGARRHYALDTGDPAFRGSVEAALGAQDAVIISDYAKGAISQPVIDLILEIARRRQIIVAADPKPSHSFIYRGVDLLTPNRQEALQMAGLKAPTPGESFPLEETFRRIWSLHEPGLLAITLGADGIALGSIGRVETVLPVEVREVFDISGAGDTVIAVMTAALAAGAVPADAAALANCAAGLVVTHFGTVPVNLEALAAAVTDR